MRGLFLNGNSTPRIIKFHNAESFGIIHIITEHCRPVLLRRSLTQDLAEARAEEDIVPQDHCDAVVADKLFAQDKRLRKAVRRGLHLVGKADAVLTAVPEKPLEIGQIRRCGDDQNIADPREHQGRERIKDHRLVIYRQELLARHLGERIQARSAAAGQYDSLHCVLLSRDCPASFSDVMSRARSARKAYAICDHWPFEYQTEGGAAAGRPKAQRQLRQRSAP